MRHTKGHETNQHGMIDAAQATYQYTGSVQVEGAPQHPWRAPRTRRTLLGHLRPSGDLADSLSVSDPLPPPGMAKLSTGFRHGLSTSAGRNAALHVVATRISMPRDDTKDTCTETHMQHVWAKTGRSRLEQVHGQRHEEYRVHAQ